MRTEEWDRETFRKVLEDIQDRTHLTEADLAELARRSRSQVNRWTRAENQPAYDPLRRLVDGLDKFGPAVRQLGIELLEAAGYAPPEPVARVSQAPLAPAEPPSPGVRVEQRNGGHVTYEVTVESEMTMEQAIDSLRPLTDVEELLINNLRIMKFEAAEVAGAVLLLRSQAARRAGPDAGRMRKKA